MGKNGLNTILSMADLEAYIEHPPLSNLARQFDFAEIAALSEALEDVYGARGGRGIALRIGRAMFSLGIKNFGAMAGMSDPVFQALPLEKRTQIGLHALASIFTRFSDQQSRVEDQDAHYLFTAEVSPFSWGRVADRPVCHGLAGIIQESMRWASQGQEYHVHEIACRATGSEYCVFKVHKKPIGPDRG